MIHDKQKLLIVIIPMVIVVIIAMILAILYFTTDFLKSNQTLFLKYISQNMDAAKVIVDNTSEKEYTNLLKQNKYESTSELTASYIQNVNTSEEDASSDINKLKLVIEGQSDYLNDYKYQDIKLTYDNGNLLRTEYVHDGEIYGIRFPDMFNQFLSVENHDLKEVAQKAGLNEEQIEMIPDTIEENDFNSMFSFTDEELASLQTKYINVLSSNISSDKYSKQKDAMITVGENSITTNAYSVTLTEEQANNVYIKMLQELRNDDIILNKITSNELITTIFAITQDETQDMDVTDAIKQDFEDYIDQIITNIQDNNIGTAEVKCTVYETKGKTVRTVLSTETEENVIDLDITDNGVVVSIQSTIASQDQENTRKVEIIKNNTDTQDTFSINFESVIGDKTSSAELYRNKNVNGYTISTETGIKYDDGNSSVLDAKYSESINIIQEIDKKIQLDETNNVILNNYDAERVSLWVNEVIERLTGKLEENQELINNIAQNEIVGQTQDNIQIEQTEGLTEVEKNRFNSRFEFYVGEDISSEQVIELIDEAKNNLKGAQVSYSNDGTLSANGSKKLQSIRLQIEKGTENADLADSVKDLIENGKKYAVTIQYDNNTEVVSFITITIK